MHFIVRKYSFTSKCLSIMFKCLYKWAHMPKTSQGYCQQSQFMIQAQVLRTEKTGVFTHAAHYASIQLFQNITNVYWSRKGFISIRRLKKGDLENAESALCCSGISWLLFCFISLAPVSHFVFTAFFIFLLIKKKSCCNSPFPMSVGKISICLKKQTNYCTSMSSLIS